MVNFMEPNISMSKSPSSPMDRVPPPPPPIGEEPPPPPMDGAPFPMDGAPSLMGEAPSLMGEASAPPPIGEEPPLSRMGEASVPSLMGDLTGVIDKSSDDEPKGRARRRGKRDPTPSPEETTPEESSEETTSPTSEKDPISSEGTTSPESEKDPTPQEDTTSPGSEKDLPKVEKTISGEQSDSSVGESSVPKDDSGLAVDDKSQVDPLNKENIRDEPYVPEAPILPVDLAKPIGEYSDKLKQDLFSEKPYDTGISSPEETELSKGFQGISLEEPEEPSVPMDSMTKEKVYDMRKTCIYMNQDMDSPLYQLVDQHPQESEKHLFYSLILLRPSINFDSNLSILSALDKGSHSDGSLLSLGLLGAPNNFENTIISSTDPTSTPSSFSFSTATGDLFLDNCPDFPKKSSDLSHGLPRIESSPVRNWVTFQVTGNRSVVLNDMLKTFLKIKPLDKTHKLTPSLFFYANHGNPDMPDDSYGDCMLCTMDRGSVVFLARDDYTFQKYTCDEITELYPDSSDFSILVYSSSQGPIEPFHGEMMNDQFLLHPVHSTPLHPTKRKLHESILDVMNDDSPSRPSKKGKTRKKPRGKPKKPRSKSKKPKKKSKKPKKKSQSKSTLENLTDDLEDTFEDIF